VAKKRKPKTRWLKTLLFFILTPFVVWALAFIIWLYWYDITGLLGQAEEKSAPRAEKPAGRQTRPADKNSQERISEEDRQKLEEILKSKK
jgi:hypothetical protein